MLRALLAALALSSLFTSGASAQSAPPAQTAAPTAEMQYTAALGRGLTAISSGDRAGAITAFRAAVQLDPARPDAVCLLASAQRAEGDLPAALEGFQACIRVARATQSRDAQRWVGRGLHGVASTLERMGTERQAEARTAWQEYVRFADGATQVATPAIGRARITVIDQVVELERVTVEVRQRIAARQAQSSAPR